MHEALSSTEELSYCFLRSFVNFQGQTGQKKIADFEGFRTVTSLLIQQGVWDDA